MNPELQIIISAIDEASEELQGIVDSLNGISDAASSVAADANESLDEIGASASEAIAPNIDAVNEELTSIAEAAEVAQGEVDASFTAMGAGMVAAVAPGIAATEAEIDGVSVYAEKAGGVIAGTMGAAITDAVGNIIGAASGSQEAVAAVNTSISDMTSATQSAQGGTAAFAQEIAATKAQIEQYHSTIEEANAEATISTGTTAEMEARQAKAASTLAATQPLLDAATQKLATFAAQQNLVGQSATGIEAAFDSVSKSMEAQGQDYDTTYQALGQLLAVTGSAPDSIQAYNAALDLSIAKGIPLQTAVTTVAQAYQGMGRGLQQYGLVLKDGIAGQDAVSAVMQKFGGTAQAVSGTLAIEWAAAGAEMNQVAIDAGATLLPQLTKVFQYIVSVAIPALDNFINKHGELVKSILALAGTEGVLMTLLGILALLAIVAGALGGPFVIASVLIVGAATLIATNWETLKDHLQTILTAITVAVGIFVAAVFGPVGILIVAVVALVEIIIDHWTQLRDDFEAIGQAIASFFAAHWQLMLSIATDGLSTIVVYIMTHWTQIQTFVEDGLKDLQAVWSTVWQGMATIVDTVWGDIENTVKSGVNDVITVLNAFISALDSIHISIPPITIPGTKIGTPAIDLGFNIPKIPMLAAGGIVYNPVLAMIGEQGPEAVVPLSSLGNGGLNGGGTNTQPAITINVNGGMFLNPQSVKQMTDYIVKQINGNLRLKNYAL